MVAGTIVLAHIVIHPITEFITKKQEYNLSLIHIFGTVDGDPAAAYRYTESRMSKISMRMLQDIDKDTVDFDPNYDCLLYTSSKNERASFSAPG